MTLLDFLIFNPRAARILDCGTRDVHMRSAFILARKIIHLCTSKVVGSFVVKTSFEIAASLFAFALKDRHDQKISKRIRGSRDPGPHSKPLIARESYRIHLCGTTKRDFCSAVATKNFPREKGFL
jgi:hypothetical protein